MEEEQLAKYYKETKENIGEQRRIIDYDMKRVLADLEKDYSTIGNLKVLHYKSEIQQAEVVYDDRVAELKEIELDLHPVLVAINAHRADPFSIQVGARSFFDTFIDEENQIYVTETYTRL
jgi:hypothetical protein